MIYSRVFIPAALLYQEKIAHMSIYHFNALEKCHLAEMVSEDFEESASAELRSRHFSEQLLAILCEVPW